MFSKTILQFFLSRSLTRDFSGTKNRINTVARNCTGSKAKHTNLPASSRSKKMTGGGGEEGRKGGGEETERIQSTVNVHT
jgi:hypothetical protein